MYKVIMPMHRKPGMSRAEFREYYETRHRMIGEKYLAGFAVKYMRRYPMALPGDDQEPDFDVILEVWYPDQETYQRFIDYIQDPAIAAEISADEANLFETEGRRGYQLEEAVSDNIGG